MKVSIIKVSANSEFKKYKKSMGGPPQNIFSVAAATPQGIDIELIDETVDMRINFKTDADLVAIFMSTPDAVKAYTVADKFRKRGKTVVMGGLHPSALPDEALMHCDAVLIGEQEGIWEELLADFQIKQLKKKYERQEPVDLALLNPYPNHLIDKRRYEGVWSVVVSRGCRFKCAYCTVHRFFNTISYRPVEHIVDEIKECSAQWIELHADNLIADREYAIKLFEAIKPLGIQWIAECTITIAEDKELLKLAAESGLTHLLVGLETPSKEALKAVGKGFLGPEKVKSYIETIHQYGIHVDSSFIFGFDQHTTDIFQETLDFARKIDLDEAHAVIMIPFPGTRLFSELETENRLLTRDWSLYDGINAVFEPKDMTTRELEKGSNWFHKNFRPPKKKRTPVTSVKKNLSNNKNPSLPSTGLLFERVKNYPWRSVFGLVLLVISIVMNWAWAFGIFFLIWAAIDIRTKQTYIFGPIRRDDHAVLYWATVGLWVALALYYFGGLAKSVISF